MFWESCVPLAAAGLGLAVLIGWLAHDPTSDLVLHEPGLDGAPPVVETDRGTVPIGVIFATGEGRPAEDFHGSWPRFRGADYDNINKDALALPDCWETAPPRVRWMRDVGEGHAGAAIHNGRIYLLDYDEATGSDMLRCLSPLDGGEIWRRGYPVDIRRNHGMSRTVPAVTDHCVLTLGPLCHVMCVDARTGDLRWTLDLPDTYGTRVPMWYAGQCPLIDDGVAVLAPAGPEVLMLGIDCLTGDVRWQTPNPHGLSMSHASIMPGVFDGERMYVYAAAGGMVGVGAEGEHLGQIRWFAPQWDRSVLAPSPVILPDGRIFVTAGYGGGSMMLRVTRQGEDFAVETLDSFRANQGLASEQQTPILLNGKLFGILPNDAGPLRNQLVCADPDDPRTFRWTSGRENRFGLGPFLVADDKLVVLSDDGELTLIKLSASDYQPLGRVQVLPDGHDAWAPMALAEGLLILRDDTRLVALELTPP